jgi:hypothetical protein
MGELSAVLTNSATVPTLAMRRGDFSELLNPANPFLRPRGHDHESADRPAVPEQRDPGGQLSPNGIALLNAYPSRRRASSWAPTTPSSAARTRRISGRTTSGSTTG